LSQHSDMKLPQGRVLGAIEDPLQKNSLQSLLTFVGVIEITTGTGKGYILADRGNIFAACFRDDSGTFQGKAALTRLKEQGSTRDGSLLFTLRSYTDQEFAEAHDVLSAAGMQISHPQDRTASTVQNILDQEKLSRLLSLPGVIAVSIFFEGFAVQSMGKADFDQVAAMAEDLLRAGKKIAHDLKIGDLQQVLLETGEKKCIIAPYQDLFICTIARNDANLGLIRLELKNLTKGD
jgi:predicted regulator of Ras-like GTPase activity (Roadblock/LC7/MglB family)